jgi:Druantia protein DruA
MTSEAIGQQFCGRAFTPKELHLIRDIVGDCTGISRFELANTVCELLDWKRPTGGLKARECMDLMQHLEAQGLFTLPGKKSPGTIRPRRCLAPVTNGKPYSPLCGSVEMFAPLDVELITSRQQRDLFRGLVSRYHYLGYAMPYGARLQYLAYVSRPGRELVGCVQFSSPAWRMKARDQWIGWDDGIRKLRLQHVVNNSRLLVVANIRNLASHLLSCCLKRLCCDWKGRYGIEPYLVETLVDGKRFHGGCYRAANFQVLGETSGRGRMDRYNQRQGQAVKTVMVYELVSNARARLTEGLGR